MKISHFAIPAVFTLAASFAFADDHKKWDEVDMNKDGELSHQEARAALPDLQLMSSGSGASASGDQAVTRDQVARALPGIEFDADDRTGPVGEEDYEKIVEQIQEREESSTTSSSTATGTPGSVNQGARPSSPDADDSSDRIPGERPAQ